MITLLGIILILLALCGEALFVVIGGAADGVGVEKIHRGLAFGLRRSGVLLGEQFVRFGGQQPGQAPARGHYL